MVIKMLSFQHGTRLSAILTLLSLCAHGTHASEIAPLFFFNARTVMDNQYPDALPPVTSARVAQNGRSRHRQLHC
jgi:hypothetical protein